MVFRQLVVLLCCAMLKIAVQPVHSVTKKTHCTVINQCALLGERLYNGTAEHPEVLVFEENTISFSNGLVLEGMKLSFVPDANPTVPYLGVWILPKGAMLYFSVTNNANQNVNIHTHGLHVKGSGADDPSVQIVPGQTFSYSFQVPSDHAGGLNWIHPHYLGDAIVSIGGMAVGLITVEDDPLNREVPVQTREAPYFYLIIQTHLPSYWVPSSKAAEFVTVNGLAGNPTLEITAQKWTRLRVLSVSISLGQFIQGQWTVPDGVTCQVVLIAKDGVYLKTPRPIPSPFVMYWNEANRNDFMVNCDGPANSVIQVYYGVYEAFQIQLLALPANEQPDTYNLNYQACLPAYLDDLFDAPVVNANDSIVLTPLLTFEGFDESDALATYNIGDVIEISTTGYGHPFHIHINHMQVMELDETGWFIPGDWQDTGQNIFNAKMKLDRFTEMMLLHCHNIVHQETYNIHGMMGLIWILGEDTEDVSWESNCPNVVTLEASPTSTPTQQPTGSPTSNCAGTTSATCSSSECHYFDPTATQLAMAFKKLTATEKATCLLDVGCQRVENLCKYSDSCIGLCNLDPACKEKKVKVKKKTKTECVVKTP